MNGRQKKQMKPTERQRRKNKEVKMHNDRSKAER